MRATVLSASLFGLVLFPACSEYKFSEPLVSNRGDDTAQQSDDESTDIPNDDEEDPPEDRPPEDGPPSNGDSGTPDTGGPPIGPPDDPPDPVVDDCIPGTVATFESGEIYVLSWDTTSASGTLVAADAGWYHIYDYSIAESGSDQWNETAYIRISNSYAPEGLSMFANCGDEWIVQDPDNSGSLPTGSRLYMGTFFLEAGSNTLTLSHYCPLYRDGSCTSMHIPDDSSSTCDSSNVNSVHFDGEGICLVPAGT